MSRELDFPLDESAKEKIRLKINQIRQSLHVSGEWPDKADDLLRHLTNSFPISNEDIDMIPLVVGDALDGIDIRVRYPSFFNKLLENPALREEFLEILDLLEAETIERASSIPNDSAPLPSSFLSESIPTSPIIEQPSPQSWRAILRRTADELGRLFNARSSSVALRSGNPLDAPSVILLREQFEINQYQFDLLLESIQPIEEPENLQLTLTLGVSSSTEDYNPNLKATLHWGEYAETAQVKQQRKTVFPTLGWHQVYREQENSFYSDLKLVLEMIET